MCKGVRKLSLETRTNSYRNRYHVLTVPSFQVNVSHLAGGYYECSYISFTSDIMLVFHLLMSEISDTTE